MKRYFFFILLIFSLNALHAQSIDSAYTLVEQMPKFNGDIYKYIVNHLELPEIKQDETINAHSVASFIVEKDGSVSSVKIIKPSMPELDSAMVKCLKAMPKWQPGIQNNRPVRVSYQMPITVELK